MSSPEPPLVPLLTQLCDALSGAERRRLVFLCGSLDSDHSPVTARDVLEAAVHSSERPWEVVREVLVQLRRLDLLRAMFQCGREEVERQRSSLPKYRVLMVNLSEDMTREDLDQFKFLLGRGVPRDRLERAKCFLDVVTELEKQGQVSSERMELIETCMRDIGRVDLARRVRTITAPEQTPAQMQRCRPIQPFSNCQQTRHTQLLQSAPEQIPPQLQRCRPIQPLSSCQQTRHVQLLQSAPEQTPPQMQRCSPIQPLSSCQQTRHVQLLQSGPSQQLLQREQTCSNSIDHYKLNTSPRGVCVIIDCVGHDGELMEQTFRTLDFSVVLRRWLSVSDCLSTLRALQHSPLLRQASAFVCCVISRGTALHLLATDAQCIGLHLDALRQMFTPVHCPALAGKPKLFFIQRYSVPEYQPAAGRSYEHSEYLETDGPGAGQYLLPTDADVFWSHCWTDDSQLQKRGHHSHYLKALMGALQAGHLRKWHVVDLHIGVNAAVCEHNQRNPSEQYHLELRHTLTKNLYLH